MPSLVKHKKEPFLLHVRFLNVLLDSVTPGEGGSMGHKSSPLHLAQKHFEDYSKTEKLDKR